MRLPKNPGRGLKASVNYKYLVHQNQCLTSCRIRVPGHKSV